MNPKQQEDLAKRLVEILIDMNIFSDHIGKKNVGGINTDLHHWMAMSGIIEKGQLIQAIREAIGIHEGECLARAWAKHIKDSGI